MAFLGGLHRLAEVLARAATAASEGGHAGENGVDKEDDPAGVLAAGHAKGMEWMDVDLCGRGEGA